MIMIVVMRLDKQLLILRVYDAEDQCNTANVDYKECPRAEPLAVQGHGHKF